MRAAFSPVELTVGRCGPYQVELGLQLDLEGLEGPLQLVDLRPGGLKTLCARRHLLVQLVELEDTQRLTVTESGPTFTREESNVKSSAASPSPCTSFPCRGGSFRRWPHTEL